MSNLLDRLAIADGLVDNADKLDNADGLDNADEGNMGDFLEMIAQWTRGKNVLREEDCMVISFGYVIAFLLDMLFCLNTFEPFFRLV